MQDQDVPTVPRKIVTERLLLRPYVEDDAEQMIAAIDESRTELDAWMGWSPTMREPEDARNFVMRTEQLWAANENFGLGIFRRDSGRYLGGTGLHRPNWRVPSMEIGYWMRTSEVGKGYVREAVLGLTRIGFGQLGMRRMVITCDAENARSRRVAEAVGYLLEGTLRNDDRTPSGDLRDTLVYSLIDTDEVVQHLLNNGSTR